MFSTAVKDLPRGTRSSRGHRLVDLVDTGGAEVAAVVPIAEEDVDRFVFMATRLGQVKRTPVSEFANVRGGGIKAIGVGSGDQLLGVAVTSGNADVLLAARSGQTIRFRSYYVREEAWRQGFVGPQSPPRLQAGWTGRVYLAPSCGSPELEPAAYGQSFERLSGRTGSAGSGHRAFQFRLRWSLR